MAVGIILYDDNFGLRESLEKLIQCSDDFLLLGSFPDPSQVEKQVKDIGPDVILMDIDMPHRSGIEAVQLIRRFNASVAIIMLTVFDDNSHVLDAICAGASGYLLKKHISDKLTEAIKDVLQGGAPMSPGIARMVIESLHKLPPSADNKYQLTPREKEILHSLAKGNSFKMIGSDLSISIDTVRTHIKRIYEKLQVHSQVEAVSKAMNERLI
ncbi:MAG: response regulator transcription factor [Chitinophagaceae bacterium]|nr:MAG: response regulator transcription factor [Chitinophagaceae bacterium]